MIIRLTSIQALRAKGSNVASYIIRKRVYVRLDIRGYVCGSHDSSTYHGCEVFMQICWLVTGLSPRSHQTFYTCIVLSCIVLSCIVLYCIITTVLDWTGLDWIRLDWIGLYCIVLCCIVLNCIYLTYSRMQPVIYNRLCSVSDIKRLKTIEGLNQGTSLVEYSTSALWHWTWLTAGLSLTSCPDGETGLSPAQFTHDNKHAVLPA